MSRPTFVHGQPGPGFDALAALLDLPIPFARLRGDRLSRVASALLRSERRHAEGAAADAAFDGGEWSGPAAARSLDRAASTILSVSGFDPDWFRMKASGRTSARWFHFALEPAMPVGDEVSR